MNKIILLLIMALFTDTKKVVVNEPINIGGVHLFSVRGADASKRSDIIYSRLRTVLTPNLKASDVTVSSCKGQAVIMVNDEILVTITNDDAVLNKSDRFSLAKKIQEKLSVLLPNLVPLERK
jgi:hypothetical protein